MATSTEIYDWIENESAAFTATLTPDALEQRVPGCPEWSLRDLAWHLGRVQRFWSATVLVRKDVEPDAALFGAEAKPGPAHAAELQEWMREGTRGLLDAIRNVPWDEPAWVWWKEPRNAGAIARHQSQEAAVHRWDAQSALGTPDALPPALAADALEEFLANRRQLASPPPVALVATDIGRPFLSGDGAVRASVSAPVADLLLFVYGRIKPDDIAYDGDGAAIRELLFAVD
jgi:uncharacterized protein (TIGR03083 family)